MKGNEKGKFGKKGYQDVPVYPTKVGAGEAPNAALGADAARAGAVWGPTKSASRSVSSGSQDSEERRTSVILP